MENSEPQPSPKEISIGDKFEGIAFTFCKAAFIVLLTQRFALPITSGLAGTFYILAFINGKTDTRCWAMNPPLIAGFWFIVCIISTYLTLHPEVLHIALPKLF